MLVVRKQEPGSAYVLHIYISRSVGNSKTGNLTITAFPPTSSSPHGEGPGVPQEYGRHDIKFMRISLRLHGFVEICLGLLFACMAGSVFGACLRVQP